MVGQNLTDPAQHHEQRVRTQIDAVDEASLYCFLAHVHDDEGDEDSAEHNGDQGGDEEGAPDGYIHYH